MLFKTKLGCSFYRSMLVILICLSISSQPQKCEGTRNSLRNCNSTMTVPRNFTNQTNGNCSALQTNGSTNNPTDDLDDEYYIVNIASMTVGSIGMLCNLLLIIAITIDPLKILRRGAWITILNLAVADTTACAALFLQLLFYQIDDWDSIKTILHNVHFFWMFGVGASFMLLTLLSIQIYMIVKYPMKSRLMLTGKKVLLSCTIVWVLAFGLGLSEISYLWTETYNFYFYIGSIAVLELAVAIQVVLKVLIAIEIWSSQNSILNVGSLNRKQQDVAKTVIILNAILIVTAFPYFLAKQIELVERHEDYSYNSLIRKFPYYYEPVALLNFVLNPLLYSLRLQDYRRSLIALFKFQCKIKHPRSNSTSRQRFTGRPSTSLEKTEMTKM